MEPIFQFISNDGFDNEELKIAYSRIDSDEEIFDSYSKAVIRYAEKIILDIIPREYADRIN